MERGLSQIQVSKAIYASDYSFNYLNLFKF